MLKIFIKKLNKETNLKVFANGLFQITGVKNNSQAMHTLKIFLDSVITIKGIHSKKIVIKDDIIFDKTDIDNLCVYDRFNYIKIYKNEK